ncbi:MAG: AI-2E family transporter [Gammaproteobacteria bacterium RIFOXYB2_FULL_38_6]|nr:MAG: AI-2E family transporter [Gammaproteobacteria bacterium RIFOXYB2_FULL_38_6]
MLQAISAWFQRNFSDPGALGLFFTLVLFILVIEFFGNLLGPILFSIVIAYLLDAVVQMFERWHFPRLLALIITYCLFIAVIVFILFALLPLLWRQLFSLVNELPIAFNNSHAWLIAVSNKYPAVLGNLSAEHATDLFKQDIANVGRMLLTFSLATIPSIITIVLYFVLVPLIVFFFIRDKAKIIHWCTRYLPSNQSLSKKVWSEVNKQIGQYMRGRAIEIVIVGTATIISFYLLGLEYAFLLGALVGLSVLIPYVGAVLVTIPVFIVGLLQWGWSMHFTYLMIIYVVIISLDANVLVPILFSEVMDLHPVTIILSVLVFGGIWGFWGIFFAIPLATVVKAVLYAWPRSNTVGAIHELPEK